MKIWILTDKNRVVLATFDRSLMEATTPNNEFRIAYLRCRFQDGVKDPSEPLTVFVVLKDNDSVVEVTTSEFRANKILETSRFQGSVFRCLVQGELPLTPVDCLKKVG